MSDVDLQHFYSTVLPDAVRDAQDEQISQVLVYFVLSLDHWQFVNAWRWLSLLRRLVHRRWPIIFDPVPAPDERITHD